MHIKNVSLICPFGNCHCDTLEICEHANKSIVSSFSGKYIIVPKFQSLSSSQNLHGNFYDRLCEAFKRGLFMSSFQNKAILSNIYKALQHSFLPPTLKALKSVSLSRNCCFHFTLELSKLMNEKAGKGHL